MDVRVWGVVEDRLIEVLAEPSLGRDDGFRIVGLPQGRLRTAADRIRAALSNSSVARVPPAVTIRLQPALAAGPTADLDLAMALAALVRVGTIGTGLRWILATGRLGLDGCVHARELGAPVGLAEVVHLLCQTPPLQYEHMFYGEQQ